MAGELLRVIGLRTVALVAQAPEIITAVNLSVARLVLKGKKTSATGRGNELEVLDGLSLIHI